jgi:hypothetical protein
MMPAGPKHIWAASVSARSRVTGDWIQMSGFGGCQAACCLTEGRCQKNYFRKTSPGRVEMRMKRKTNRITPNRSFAWLL